MQPAIPDIVRIVFHESTTESIPWVRQRFLETRVTVQSSEKASKLPILASVPFESYRRLVQHPCLQNQQFHVPHD